jgi:hypothetical protein
VTAPNGKLVSVFGDTFSGRRVGRGDWRSPVVLIGTGDATRPIRYERAGGPDPDYARQLWHYVHDDAGSGWTRSGISTVIPSDLLRVEDAIQGDAGARSRYTVNPPSTFQLAPVTYPDSGPARKATTLATSRGWP